MASRANTHALVPFIENTLENFGEKIQFLLQCVFFRLHPVFRVESVATNTFFQLRREGSVAWICRTLYLVECSLLRAVQ